MVLIIGRERDRVRGGGGFRTVRYGIDISRSTASSQIGESPAVPISPPGPAPLTGDGSLTSRVPGRCVGVPDANGGTETVAPRAAARALA